MIFDFIFNRFVMTPKGIMRLKEWERKSKDETDNNKVD